MNLHKNSTNRLNSCPLEQNTKWNNNLMYKLHTLTEWAYSIISTHWKLSMHFLFFNFSKKTLFVWKKILSTHSLCNFKFYYRGNNVANMFSFHYIYPTIEEHANELNIFLSSDRVKNHHQKNSLELTMLAEMDLKMRNYIEFSKSDFFLS